MTRYGLQTVRIIAKAEAAMLTALWTFLTLNAWIVPHCVLYGEYPCDASPTLVSVVEAQWSWLQALLHRIW